MFLRGTKHVDDFVKILNASQYLTGDVSVKGSKIYCELNGHDAEIDVKPSSIMFKFPELRDSAEAEPFEDTDDFDAQMGDYFIGMTHR